MTLQQLRLRIEMGYLDLQKENPVRLPISENFFAYEAAI
jgi:hypothetical protein